MRISDWSSDVCSSDLQVGAIERGGKRHVEPRGIAPGDAHPAAGRIEPLRVEAGERRILVPHRGGIQKGKGLDREAVAIGGDQRAIARLQRHRDAAVADHRAGVIAAPDGEVAAGKLFRSEEHTSELQSLMRLSYAVFCLKKTKQAGDQL